MASADNSSKILHANQEHAGVRFFVLIILLIVFVITFLALNVLFDNLAGSLVAEFSLVLSCVGGLIVGLAVAGLGEYILKRTWPSGLSVVFSERGVEANLASGEHLALDWSTRFWMLKWYFSLLGYPRGGRERRVPSRYYCLACQLQQDEVRFIVYSYLPIERANQLLSDNEFHEIKPGEYYERNTFSRWSQNPDRPQVPTTVLAGKEGPFWMAEQRRWIEGLELNSGDFEQFLSVVSEHAED